MKRAIILHGLQSTADSNWFPWLKAELEQRDYQVWLPDLPGADHPVASHWVSYLLSSSWEFNQSLVIGHSAGAVAALYLAQSMPDQIRLKGVVAVSAFLPVAPDNELYQELKDLHDTQFDFAKMQKGCDNFLFVHSDDDPYCPLEGAQQLAQQTGGSLQLLRGGQHFSASRNPAFRQFPRLLEVMQKYLLL
jgi:uncharacterized protein